MKPSARLPWFTLLGALAALALGAASPATTAALEFSRDGLLRGEWWRLFTGHFTHFTPAHLAWDVVAWLALGAFVEVASRRAFALALGGASLAISLGVFQLAPEFATYRGLSGLDSALFAAAAAMLLQRARAARSPVGVFLPAAALLGFLGKIAFELATATTLFVAPSDAFVPVPLAHLLGAAVGALGALRISSAPSTAGGLRPDVTPAPDVGA